MADTSWTEFFKSGVSAWAVPLCVLGGSVLVAWTVEKLLRRRLKAWAEKHPGWQGGEIIIRGIRGMAFVWLMLAGIAVAATEAPISGENLGVIHKITQVLVILSATTLIARLCSGFFSLYASRFQGFGSTSIFSNIIGAIVFTIGLLVIFQTIGFSIAPILTALGVGGLAVALALQDTLSNVFAGIHIIVSRHVRPGDYVRMDSSDEGYVVDIGWRNTTIRSPLNNLIVVPNAKLASAIVTNYSLPEKILIMKILVGVSYNSDLDHVQHVALEVAKSVLSHPGRTINPPPAVHFHTFADSSINFDMLLPVMEFADQGLLRHDFVVALHKRFRDEHIEIPYPIRTVFTKALA